MKRIIIYIFILVSLSALNSMDLFAKDAVKVRGMVFHENGSMDGAIIDVFENGEKKEVFITKANGKFKLELELNKEYIIQFSQFGKCTKKLQIDTNVPEDIGGVWQVSFEVELFDVVKGLDLKALEAPIAIVSYNPIDDFFDYDAKYSALMAEKINDIHQQFENLAK